MTQARRKTDDGAASESSHLSEKLIVRLVLLTSVYYKHVLDTTVPDSGVAGIFRMRAATA